MRLRDRLGDETMELRDLRYFITLADELDVDVAAKHVGLSPSVLRRHILDLEESLGCSLFRRHGESVTVSAAGQVFYPRAKDILASAAAAAGEVRATAAALASRIRVGHYGLWWMRRYAPALKRFHHQNPGLQLNPMEMMPVDLASALRCGDVDIALMEHVDVALRIEMKVRRIEALDTCILLPKAHRYAKRVKVAFHELIEETWLSWDEHLYPGRRHLLLQAASALNERPCISQEVVDEEALHAQILAGNGIGYAAYHQCAELPAGLRCVRLVPSVMEFPVFLAWRKDADNFEQLELLAKCLLAGVPQDKA